MNNDYDELRSSGFTPQKQKDHFSLKVKVTGGHLTAGDLAAIAKTAENYGGGQVHLTSTQGLEVPFIKLKDIDAVKADLANHGLTLRTSGPGIKTITACQGRKVCKNGLIDSKKLAEILDEAFSQAILPPKFKIGISGCLNNCLNADKSDIGIKGAVVPFWSFPDKCIYCGLCEKACRGEAIKIHKGEKWLKYDSGKCIYCGRCIKECPENSWSGVPGFLVYFGGFGGQQIQTGRSVLPVLRDKKEVIEVIGRSLNFFELNCPADERFGQTIKRVGWSEFEKHMNVFVSY